MAHTSTNVHAVVGVSIERKRFSDFRALTITFTTADGSTVTVDAFSAEPLALIDADERIVAADSTLKVAA